MENKTDQELLNLLEKQAGVLNLGKKLWQGAKKQGRIFKKSVSDVSKFNSEVKRGQKMQKGMKASVANKKEQAFTSSNPVVKPEYKATISNPEGKDVVKNTILDSENLTASAKKSTPKKAPTPKTDGGLNAGTGKPVIDKFTKFHSDVKGANWKEYGKVIMDNKAAAGTYTGGVGVAGAGGYVALKDKKKK